MKVLNLYAGIGGNRKLWPNKEIEVTAVELNPEIAKIYQDFFPKDKVVVADAHQYLLEHYKEFDFIWASPPCPTHSRLNYPAFKKGNVRYPNMSLYQEIIFLTWCFKGKWVVENVISYYNPLIKPKLLGRHYYWSNFHIQKISQHINDDIANGTYKEMQEYHGFNLDNYNINKEYFNKKFNLQQIKRLFLRNCVNPKHGLHIFNCAFKERQVTLNGLE